MSFSIGGRRPPIISITGKKSQVQSQSSKRMRMATWEAEAVNGNFGVWVWVRGSANATAISLCELFTPKNRKPTESTRY